MKSRITVKVEFFAGTTIREAVTEAKLKAEFWEVAFVEFDFNGKSYSISANADIEKVLSDFYAGIKSRFGYVA